MSTHAERMTALILALPLIAFLAAAMPYAAMLTLGTAERFERAMSAPFHAIARKVRPVRPTPAADWHRVPPTVPVAGGYTLPSATPWHLEPQSDGGYELITWTLPPNPNV